MKAIVRNAALLAAWLCLAPPAPAQEPPAAEPDGPVTRVDADAEAALRRMADYLAAQKQFRMVCQSTFDVVEDGQKLQYTRRLEVDLKRPNRLRAESTGDDWDKAYWYDGATVTIHDRDQKFYGVVTAPGTIDAMFDHMNDRYGLSVPTADLLFNDVYATLMQGVLTGRHVGMHHVGNRVCHHLAFTQNTVDWQIWVDADEERPLPRKLVVTYKTAEASPQFAAVFLDWDVRRKFDDEQFVFAPPQDAFKIEMLPIDAPPAADPSPGVPAENKP